ncbi:MAG: peptidase E [Anaerolineae bacterium]|nr:peptidase E [Anaerolineae bacterium]
MQQIIAIGGGGYASRPSDISLEAYVLAQTNALRPKVCYLPQAGGESREYIVRFYEAFIQLGAQPSWFSLFGSIPADWSAHLLAQDALFVGGGNTRSMLALWREWGVDTVLHQALEEGIVLAGVSAGAICWFKHGITDSSQQLSVLDCLGFLEGSCCPHYDSEPERKPTYRDLVAKGQALPGFALDDGAAVHLVNGKLKQVVTSRLEARGYRLVRQNNEAFEEELPVTRLG